MPLSVSPEQEIMKKSSTCSILITVLTLFYLSVPCVPHNFDFFYFVQQWPGSCCDSSHGCCYPISGKPATDFIIHGLSPHYNNGSYPSDCNPANIFNIIEITDLMPGMVKNWPTLTCPSSDDIIFWLREWMRHGTCSEHVLSQHAYFEAALNLKRSTNLLQVLKKAGIEPNDKFYSISSITNAIKKGVGFAPGIQCNLDSSKNSQLYQIFLCVDCSGSKIIECPVLPRGRCASTHVQFPKF